MSTWAIIGIIALVLGIIISNIMLGETQRQHQVWLISDRSQQEKALRRRGLSARVTICC